MNLAKPMLARIIALAPTSWTLCLHVLQSVYGKAATEMIPVLVAGLSETRAPLPQQEDLEETRLALLAAAEEAIHEPLKLPFAVLLEARMPDSGEQGFSPELMQMAYDRARAVFGDDYKESDAVELVAAAAAALGDPLTMDFVAAHLRDYADTAARMTKARENARAGTPLTTLMQVGDDCLATLASSSQRLLSLLERMYFDSGDPIPEAIRVPPMTELSLPEDSSDSSNEPFQRWMHRVEYVMHAVEKVRPSSRRKTTSSSPTAKAAAVAAPAPSPAPAPAHAVANGTTAATAVGAEPERVVGGGGGEAVVATEKPQVSHVPGQVADQMGGQQHADAAKILSTDSRVVVAGLHPQVLEAELPRHASALLNTEGGRIYFVEPKLSLADVNHGTRTQLESDAMGILETRVDPAVSSALVSFGWSRAGEEGLVHVTEGGEACATFSVLLQVPPPLENIGYMADHKLWVRSQAESQVLTADPYVTSFYRRRLQNLGQHLRESEQMKQQLIDHWKLVEQQQQKQQQEREEQQQRQQQQQQQQQQQRQQQQQGQQAQMRFPQHATATGRSAAGIAQGMPDMPPRPAMTLPDSVSAGESLLGLMHPQGAGWNAEGRPQGQSMPMSMSMSMPMRSQQPPVPQSAAMGDPSVEWLDSGLQDMLRGMYTDPGASEGGSAGPGSFGLGPLGSASGGFMSGMGGTSGPGGPGPMTSSSASSPLYASLGQMPQQGSLPQTQALAPPGGDVRSSELGGLGGGFDGGLGGGLGTGLGGWPGSMLGGAGMPPQEGGPASRSWAGGAGATSQQGGWPFMEGGAGSGVGGMWPPHSS